MSLKAHVGYIRLFFLLFLPRHQENPRITVVHHVKGVRGISNRLNS